MPKPKRKRTLLDTKPIIPFLEKPVRQYRTRGIAEALNVKTTDEAGRRRYSAIYQRITRAEKKPTSRRRKK